MNSPRHESAATARPVAASPVPATPGSVRHWPEYGIEALGLGLFMLSASTFGVWLEHPDSPARQLISDAFIRRVLMGVAMGGTAAALIYSPWGRRSGAHFNPAVTLTFFCRGQVAARDLAGYVAAHFLGGTLGMLLASVVLSPWLGHASVHYVATVPGPAGVVTAFLAETAIAAVLMSVVLHVSHAPALARFTGLCAAACVTWFIAFEAPLSGMSLNPARTFASALVARDFTALWLYFVAPFVGMLGAAQAFDCHRRRAPTRRACAKLHHATPHRCIFCEHQQRVLAASRSR